MAYKRPDSADYWHRGADNLELTLAERHCCAQNAFNHIENALAAEVEKNKKLTEALELVTSQLGYAYRMQKQGSPNAASDHRNFAFVEARTALNLPTPSHFGLLNDEFINTVVEMLAKEERENIRLRLVCYNDEKTAE